MGAANPIAGILVYVQPVGKTLIGGAGFSPASLFGRARAGFDRSWPRLDRLL